MRFLFYAIVQQSFSLEKWTGKKCYFLGARDLNIALGVIHQAIGNGLHYQSPGLPFSADIYYPFLETVSIWINDNCLTKRFPEVAEFILVCWLEIWGTIRAGILSPQTSYVAYLVYEVKDCVSHKEGLIVEGIEIRPRMG